MDVVSDELRTCPFCGSWKVYSIRVEALAAGHDELWAFECAVCGARGPKVERIGPGGCDRVREEARQKWNERWCW
jgi:hypothetical protein